MRLEFKTVLTSMGASECQTKVLVLFELHRNSQVYEDVRYIINEIDESEITVIGGYKFKEFPDILSATIWLYKQYERLKTRTDSVSNDLSE